MDDFDRQIDEAERQADLARQQRSEAEAIASNRWRVKRDAAADALSTRVLPVAEQFVRKLQESGKNANSSMETSGGTGPSLKVEVHDGPFRLLEVNLYTRVSQENVTVDWYGRSQRGELGTFQMSSLDQLTEERVREILLSFYQKALARNV